MGLLQSYDRRKKIHTQFCRKVLGVKSSTSNDITRSDLGLMDMQCRRLIQINTVLAENYAL